MYTIFSQKYWLKKLICFFFFFFFCFIIFRTSARLNCIYIHYNFLLFFPFFLLYHIYKLFHVFFLFLWHSFGSFIDIYLFFFVDIFVCVFIWFDSLGTLLYLYNSYLLLLFHFVAIVIVFMFHFVLFLSVEHILSVRCSI